LGIEIKDGGCLAARLGRGGEINGDGGFSNPSFLVRYS
jgi:hypothetical protein